VAAAVEPGAGFDAAEQDAIREAVLRDMFKRPVGIRHLIFVRCDKDKDPSESLIANLADTKLRFRKASRVKEGPSQTTDWMYFDRDTGEPGVIVTLSCIRRTIRGRAELRGQHSKAGLNGFGDTYLVEKKDGRWVVVKKSEHSNN
jgi:hypothetical protein